jgi:thiamine pyrophosphokinase
MSIGKVLVVGSGSADIEQLKSYADMSDYIIACDGGMGHCKKAELIPDVIIGDYDSVKPEDKAYFDSLDIESYTYPTHKDMTDSEIGINLALDRGADEIYLMGLSGTRLDHTIANIQLLMLPLQKKVPAVIADKHNQIRLTDSEIEISGTKGDTISLLPLTNEVCGITTTNLEYPLNNADIKLGSSLGVSNVMLCDKVMIKISSGILAVIKSKD